MSYVQKTTIDRVGLEGPGLVFIVYPEAIATMSGSVFWSIIFFLMLITLGLDSTFGGLEAMITALCDEYPRTIGRRRELFVLLLLAGIYLCALPTMTYVSIDILRELIFTFLCYIHSHFIVVNNVMEMRHLLNALQNPFTVVSFLVYPEQIQAFLRVSHTSTHTNTSNDLLVIKTIQAFFFLLLNLQLLLLVQLSSNKYHLT